MLAPFNDRLDTLRHKLLHGSRVGLETLGLWSPSNDFPSNPAHGDLFFEKDTNRLYAYSGSAWKLIGGDVPACRIYRDAVQSFADATEAAVAFNVERFDNDNMHDNATQNSRITFNTAGLYDLVFHGEFQFAADYVAYYAYFLHNGAGILCTDLRASTAITHEPRLILTTTFKMAVGDYVEVKMLQDNSVSGARDLQVQTATSPEFTATFLKADW